MDEEQLIDDLAGEEYTFDRAGVAGGSGRLEGAGEYCRRCTTEARCASAQ